MRQTAQENHLVFSFNNNGECYEIRILVARMGFMVAQRG